MNNGGQDTNIHFVQAAFVDIECREAVTGNGLVDRSRAFYLCKIADTTQQGIGNTRRATTAPRNFSSAVFTHRDIQDFSRTVNNAYQCWHVVIIEVAIDPETRPQRRREQAHAGSCAHEGKWIQGDLDTAGIRPRIDHNVDAVILHGRI